MASVLARRSRRRASFDAVCGIALPALFVLVDPAVFRPSELAGGAYLGAFKAFGYAALGIAVTALALVLTNHTSSGFAAGLLVGASTVALALGVVLLPLSFFGAFLFGLGLLGLSPFLASFIYARNAQMLRLAAPGRAFAIAAIFGTFVFFASATAAQMSINRTVNWAVQHPDDAAAIRLLHAVSALYDADQLVWDYQSAEPASERGKLAAAYQVMTGNDIKVRAQRLAD